MSLGNVQSALISRLSGFLNGLQVGYPNKAMSDKPKPKGSNKWAQISFVPNTPGEGAKSELGNSGRDFATGFLQVDMNYAPNTGDGAARDDFEAIRALFPKGSSIAHDGQSVSIKSTGRTQGRDVDGWYRVSVTINWYAQVPR